MPYESGIIALGAGNTSPVGDCSLPSVGRKPTRVWSVKCAAREVISKLQWEQEKGHPILSWEAE